MLPLPRVRRNDCDDDQMSPVRRLVCDEASSFSSCPSHQPSPSLSSHTSLSSACQGKRRMLPQHARSHMQDFFVNVSRKPTRQQKEQLAKKLHLTEKQVETFFSNLRQRFDKSKKKPAVMASATVLSRPSQAAASIISSSSRPYASNVSAAAAVAAAAAATSAATTSSPVMTSAGSYQPSHSASFLSSLAPLPEAVSGSQRQAGQTHGLYGAAQLAALAQRSISEREARLVSAIEQMSQPTTLAVDALGQSGAAVRDGVTLVQPLRRMEQQTNSFSASVPEAYNALGNFGSGPL